MVRLSLDRSTFVRLRAGFTLVELMVVATLFSLIAFAMASSFVSGMRLWDRAQQRDAAQTDALLALEVMARELRQSVNVPLVTFQGTAHQVSFPALVQGELVNIAYEYDGSEKRLRRRHVSFKELVEEKIEEVAYEKTLFSSADEVLIAFGTSPKDTDVTGYEWVDEWEEDRGVPQAVRVTITIKDETLTKIIFIPIAS